MNWAEEYGQGFYVRLISCRRPGEKLHTFCKRGGFRLESLRLWEKTRQFPEYPLRINDYADNLGVNPLWLWFRGEIPNFSQK